MITRIGFIVLGLLITNIAQGKTTVTLGLASNFSDISTSTSNPFGNYFRDGVTLALEDSKSRLNGLGIKINTKEFDYQTSTTKASKAASDAAASDAVAVVGYNWSSHALIAAPIHQQARLPMISPSATADRLGTMGAYVHVACFNNSFMAAGLARVAVDRLKAKTAAIVVTTDCAYCQDLAINFRREFERKGGRIVAEVSVLGTDKNFSDAAKTIKSANPDVVLVPNQELVSARIIASILDTSLRRPFLGGDGWGDVGDQFFQILNGRPLEGFSVSHWHPEINDKKVMKFSDGYKKRFGKIPNDTSVLAYDATKIFVEALINAKTKDREGVEEALNHLAVFEGVTGHFQFTKGQAPLKSIILLKTGPKRFEVAGKIYPK